MTAHDPPAGSSTRRAALRFVVLLGVVSLFADMTYEGARSITGPYLAVLGASGAAVGLVAGGGELIGYGLRLVSGIVADRTGWYWALTLAGFALNLLAVPLLALTGRWEWAAALMIAERLGKAVRTPARDAMLSHATREVGHGWGFGLHEALDQIGAVLGPLTVATVLLISPGGYRSGFAVLLVPALAALGLLLAAWRLYPQPRHFEDHDGPRTADAERLPRAFWIYIGAVALVAAGYADFPLIAYHFGRRGVLSPTWIPLSYALAMGVDALAALLFGALFDRRGFLVLVGAVVLSSLFAPLVFWGSSATALVGMALWGVGMGAQESIMRAAVAGMVAPDRRGSAYGVLNACYGVAWFLGSALMGLLYDVSLTALVAFSVIAQLAAIPAFVVVAGRMRRPRSLA
jgi:predicted MFS family arabinose efflux permease